MSLCNHCGEEFDGEEHFGYCGDCILGNAETETLACKDCGAAYLDGDWGSGEGYCRECWNHGESSHAYGTNEGCGHSDYCDRYPYCKGCVNNGGS